MKHRSIQSLKVLLAAALFSFCGASASQAVTACVNNSTQNPSSDFSFLSVVFDSDSKSCVMSTSSFIPYPYMLLFQVASGTFFVPDIYTASTGYAPKYAPADSLMVEGLVGDNSVTPSSLAVFKDFSGSVTAIILATLQGQQYRMVVEMEANPEGSVRGLSATVSEVPLPAALPLLATAIAGLAYAGRRKRKAALAHA